MRRKELLAGMPALERLKEQPETFGSLDAVFRESSLNDYVNFDRLLSDAQGGIWNCLLRSRESWHSARG